jgi:hypothetical protein
VLELEPVEPVVVEPVLVPVLLVLGFVLLPVLVLGVSFRTCLVTLSQHFTVAEDVVLDEGDVVVEVCATASPKLPVSIAAAISPIPVIRMSAVSLPDCGESGESSPRRGRPEAAASRSLPVAWQKRLRSARPARLHRSRVMSQQAERLREMANLEASRGSRSAVGSRRALRSAFGKLGTPDLKERQRVEKALRKKPERQV